MNHLSVSLSDFFNSHRDCNEPMVLATVAHTSGSTYRKAGAQMLIAPDGSAAGLLSGGCLEADLMERASAVLGTGAAIVVEYDTRNSDDLLWGIGLGCEGAMSILMTRLDRANHYQPFAYVQQCRRAYVAAKIALVTASDNPAYPLGSAYWPDSIDPPPRAVRSALAPSPAPLRAERKARKHQQHSVATIAADNATFLVMPIELPTQLLVLGAGPDAMPLVEIAALMGWQVTVLDHRPAYAVPERFPRARLVTVNPAGALPQHLGQAHYDAAVVMSHHLTSDQLYLAALAGSTIPYIGLLGPAPRRARLMSELGDKATQLADRLYGPVGLDLGANTPETIALAIISEIQAALAGRPGGSFSEHTGDKIQGSTVPIDSPELVTERESRGTTRQLIESRES